MRTQYTMLAMVWIFEPFLIGLDFTGNKKKKNCKTKFLFMYSLVESYKLYI